MDGFFIALNPLIDRCRRYFTWVKSTENSPAKPTVGQKANADVESGLGEEHDLNTIFEAKEDGDERAVLGQWTNGNRVDESTDRN